MAITISDPTDAIRYRLERRISEPDDSTTQWRFLANLDPPESNRLIYDDVYGMPGFEYEYRLTKLTNTGSAPAIERGPFEMYSVRDLYGFGTPDGAQLRFKTDSKDLDLRHRVWRYNSRLDTSPVEVGTPTIDDEVTDPQPIGFYRYKVEYVKSDGNGGWEVQETTNEIVVKVEDSMLGIPRDFTAYHPPKSGHAQLQWDAPQGIHRANFGLYEILRRNAEDIYDPFLVIISTPDTYVVDEYASKDSYFDYKVRAVSWQHQHGEMSETSTAPTIPPTQCTVEGGESKNVRGMELGLPTAPPVNKQYTFSAWMTANNPAEPCIEVSPDDWYVERSTTYQHMISDDCPTEQSCDLVGGDSGIISTPFEPAVGSFRIETRPGSTWRSLVWYDESELQPGLHQFKYRMCSYGMPRVCEEYIGRWIFQGVESIPFSQN